MSFLDRFRRTPPTARIEPLPHARACPASTRRPSRAPAFEFERLLADRSVLADGLFLGRSQVPSGFVLSRRVADEAEILTLAMAPEARRPRTPLLLHHLDELARAGVRTASRSGGEQRGARPLPPPRLPDRRTAEGYYAKPDGSKVAALTMSATL